MDETSDYMISPVLSIDIESSVQEAALFMTADHSIKDLIAFFSK